MCNPRFNETAASNHYRRRSDGAKIRVNPCCDARCRARAAPDASHLECATPPPRRLAVAVGPPHRHEAAGGSTCQTGLQSVILPPVHPTAACAGSPRHRRWIATAQPPVQGATVLARPQNSGRRCCCARVAHATEAETPTRPQPAGACPGRHAGRLRSEAADTRGKTHNVARRPAKRIPGRDERRSRPTRGKNGIEANERKQTL